MYRIEQCRRDRQNQVHDRMELINNAADARELHWEANKHTEPRPFYHWFAQVHHPPSAESAQQSSTSTILSTTPQGLIPHTITAPSTIKKKKKSLAPNSPVQKPSALDLPNDKKLHYGNMVQHQSSANPPTTPTSQFPDTMN